MGVERSPEDLTLFIWTWVFSLTFTAAPLYILCLISFMWTLSSPKYAVIFPKTHHFQMWYKTSDVIEHHSNIKKCSRTNHMKMKCIWIPVRQHSLLSCSLVLPFLLLLCIPCCLLLYIVPCSLTLHLSCSFPSSWPELWVFWQEICALGQAYWHWTQIGHSAFFWGKMMIAHLYCTVSILSIWKLMIILAFNAQMGRGSLISPNPSKIQEC